MRNYVLLWILIIVLCAVALLVLESGWAALSVEGIFIVFVASAIGAIVIANELRRPTQKEYYRKKALYPKIPDK